MTTERPPCPFCGGSEITVSLAKAGVEWWAVDCDKCGANVLRSTQNAAIAAWNTRPQPIVTTDGLVERLNAVIETGRSYSDNGECHDDMGGRWPETVLVNPDGPEAVRAIQSLTDHIASLERALEPLALLFGGGVNMNDPLSKWLTMAQLQDAHDALSTTHPLNGDYA